MVAITRHFCYNVIMSKYKYYFKKPKAEITKDFLQWLGMAGAIFIAGQSPYFVRNLTKEFKKWRKYKTRNLSNTFYRLRKEGCLDIQKKGHRVYISLTEKGRRMANWLQIDSLEIKKPKKWDKKWRIVIFDIVQLKTLMRNAFREKLKELGFCLLQKSVWVCPYECQDEIELLRDFFGLNKKEIRLITAENIEEDTFLRRIFKL